MPAKGSVREKNDIKIREPKMYNVIMHNDDFTPMDFVVEILVTIFHKDKANANALMLHVHKNGKAVAGCYPYDIAVTKTTEAQTAAREKGYPFRMTVEESE